jgi:hypothetical protein
MGLRWDPNTEAFAMGWFSVTPRSQTSCDPTVARRWSRYEIRRAGGYTKDHNVALSGVGWRLRLGQPPGLTLQSRGVRHGMRSGAACHGVPSHKARGRVYDAGLRSLTIRSCPRLTLPYEAFRCTTAKLIHTHHHKEIAIDAFATNRRRESIYLARTCTNIT